MEATNVFEEIQMLVNELNGASRKYYVDGQPPLSDEEYDREYARLEKLERETGIVLSNSPTRNVGAEPDDPNKRPHAQRMYSLDKINGEEKLEAHIAKLMQEHPGERVVAELKFDGISAELIYKKGFLVDALTRGNGVYGRSIFEHVCRMDSVPKQLNEQVDIDIRGEIYSSRWHFNRYNATAAVPLKNERNATAGALAGQDYTLVKEIGLHFVAYDAGKGGEIFDTAEELLGFCAGNGFDIGDVHIMVTTPAAAVAAAKAIESMRDRLDHLIDGVVYKFSSRKLREELSYTEKSPRWAFAYKFTAEGEWTTLTDVSWEISKSGKVTPIAVFDPVELGGVSVGRATLNNAAFVEAMGIGIGDDIYIERANDVIPKLAAHEKSYDSKPVTAPTHCAVCGAELERDGVYLVCKNPNCPAQLAGRLAHFASRNGMNIKSLGDKMAQQLVDSGKIKEPGDLYSITREEMEAMGFSRTKCDRFFEEIQISKGAPLGNILYALSIPGVGKGLAYGIGDQVLSYKALMSMSVKALSGLRGVSAAKAKTIHEFLHSDFTACRLQKYILN